MLNEKIAYYEDLQERNNLVEETLREEIKQAEFKLKKMEAERSEMINKLEAYKEQAQSKAKRLMDLETEKSAELQRIQLELNDWQSRCQEQSEAAADLTRQLDQERQRQIANQNKLKASQEQSTNLVRHLIAELCSLISTITSLNTNIQVDAHLIERLHQHDVSYDELCDGTFRLIHGLERALSEQISLSTPTPSLTSPIKLAFTNISVDSYVLFVLIKQRWMAVALGGDQFYLEDESVESAERMCNGRDLKSIIGQIIEKNEIGTDDPNVRRYQVMASILSVNVIEPDEVEIH